MFHNVTAVDIYAFEVNVAFVHAEHIYVYARKFECQ